MTDWTPIFGKPTQYRVSPEMVAAKYLADCDIASAKAKGKVAPDYDVLVKRHLLRLGPFVEAAKASMVPYRRPRRSGDASVWLPVVVAGLAGALIGLAIA